MAPGTDPQVKPLFDVEGGAIEFEIFGHLSAGGQVGGLHSSDINQVFPGGTQRFNLRIQKAKDLLLKHPDLRVREIAYKLGYENESYFGSIFKKTEGFSPGKFRELYGVYEKN